MDEESKLDRQKIKSDYFRYLGSIGHKDVEIEDVTHMWYDG